MGTLNVDEPFFFRQGIAAGISRRKLASGPYRRLMPGVYIGAGAPQDARIDGLTALLVAGPGTFLSHFQAARLHGGIVPDTELLHVSVHGTRHRSRRHEVVVHSSSRTPTTFRGLPVTTPEDTFVDLARHLSLVDLVVLGDSLVRKKRTTPQGLVRAARTASARAARGAALVRAAVDSPMETRSRLLVVLAGLPEPEVNVCFYDGFGQLRRRLDLAYRKHRLAIEYDGRQHAESQTQWESDVARREEFDRADWRIVTLLAKDIYRVPGQTLDRITTAMRHAGMRVPALSEEWRRHFPGHGSPA